jgi:hypothetical protein
MKKVEMDAKKNALRSEDILKGVFVLVGSLPKKNRKKSPYRWQQINKNKRTLRVWRGIRFSIPMVFCVPC